MRFGAMSARLVARAAVAPVCAQPLGPARARHGRIAMVLHLDPGFTGDPHRAGRVLGPRSRARSTDAPDPLGRHVAADPGHPALREQALAVRRAAFGPEWEGRVTGCRAEASGARGRSAEDHHADPDPSVPGR